MTYKRETNSEQEKIGAIIGTVCTEPISGTTDCDVAGQNATAVLQPVQQPTVTTEADGREFANMTTVSVWRPPSTSTSSSSPTPSVNPPTNELSTPASVVRTKSASKKESQNEKMVVLEEKISESVGEIKEELANTNELIRGVVIQMNRTNDILSELVSVISGRVNLKFNQ